MTQDPYKVLEKRYHRIGAIKEAQAILHWDMAVMMPSGSAEGRAAQLAELDLVIHEILKDPEIEDLLTMAESEPPISRAQRSNLAEMRRMQIHANAIGADLVVALTEASSKCEMRWRQAKPANDFKLVSKELQNLLSLVQKKAEGKAESLRCRPYEALMDEYEPGLTIQEIDTLFDDLLAFLPKLLEKVLTKQQPAGLIVGPSGNFPIDRQRDLALTLMTRLGFNFELGRLDMSLHPFCGGVPEDIRITTRYSEESFVESLMGVLHETGHALYERNLPREWRLQPAGEARGMALHESQSLLVEMQLCRSTEFLEFISPLIKTTFDSRAEQLNTESLIAYYRKVEPGFIRVDADEVTYPFHVVLRYNIEKSLISGDLLVSDLPDAWNDAMRNLLDIVPPDDQRGCLQDIHWFSGSFGYFPTYTMGAVAAAQIYAAIQREYPDIREGVRTGDFSKITEWCCQKIHRQGSLESTSNILINATGEPLNARAFQRHIEARYLT